MTKMIRIADLPDFDFSEHLDSEQAMAEYLTVILEENDPALLAAALGDIARARGMSDIAKASGINHFTFFTEFRNIRTGEDLLPRLRELFAGRFFDYGPRAQAVALSVPRSSSTSSGAFFTSSNRLSSRAWLLGLNDARR